MLSGSKGLIFSLLQWYSTANFSADSFWSSEKIFLLWWPIISVRHVFPAHVNHFNGSTNVFRLLRFFIQVMTEIIQFKCSISGEAILISKRVGRKAGWDWTVWKISYVHCEIVRLVWVFLVLVDELWEIKHADLAAILNASLQYSYAYSDSRAEP